MPSIPGSGDGRANAMSWKRSQAMPIMTARHWTLVITRGLVATILVLLATAPAFAQAPARGGTLVLGIEADPDILDPHVGTGWVTWRVDYQIYEGLVKEDLTVKPTAPGPAPIVPSLATSWDV